MLLLFYAECAIMRRVGSNKRREIKMARPSFSESCGIGYDIMENCSHANRCYQKLECSQANQLLCWVVNKKVAKPWDKKGCEAIRALEPEAALELSLLAVLGQRIYAEYDSKNPNKRFVDTVGAMSDERFVLIVNTISRLIKQEPSIADAEGN